MSTIDTEHDPDLITVHEFATRYRVDESVVRGWAKRGYIDYVLVGPRQMRKVRVSELVKPARPELEPTDAISRLMAKEGLDYDTAKTVVESMSAEDIGMLETVTEGMNGQSTQVAQAAEASTPGTADPDPQPAVARKSTHRTPGGGKKNRAR